MRLDRFRKKGETGYHVCSDSNDSLCCEWKELDEDILGQQSKPMSINALRISQIRVGVFCRVLLSFGFAPLRRFFPCSSSGILIGKCIR